MPLRRFFLNTRISGALRLTLDDGDDTSAREKRGSGHQLATVLLDQQHVVERDFGPFVALEMVDHERLARRHLHLVSAALDNRVHACFSCR